MTEHKQRPKTQPLLARENVARLLSEEHDWGFSSQSQDEEIPTQESESKYQTALENPIGVYDHPQAVIQDASLNNQQKQEILKNWVAKATDLYNSETQNFGDKLGLLADINNALNRLAQVEQSSTHPMPNP